MTRSVNPIVNIFQNAGNVKILSWGRVALLGIAQRTVHAEYTANRRNQKRAKALQLNTRTAGDWLKVKRLEKNLTRGHVAAKMGIATSLVCSWESSTQLPDIGQLKVLAAVLGFDAKDFYMHQATS
jgi:ribosome-binding protein aMBF1 (putative translation factor)